MKTFNWVNILEKTKANILCAQLRQNRGYTENTLILMYSKLVGWSLKRILLGKERKRGKLDPKWVGQYTIVGNPGHGLCRIQEVDNPTKFISCVNSVHLKEYKLSRKVGITHWFNLFIYNRKTIYKGDVGWLNASLKST